MLSYLIIFGVDDLSNVFPISGSEGVQNGLSGGLIWTSGSFIFVVKALAKRKGLKRENEGGAQS